MQSHEPRIIKRHHSLKTLGISQFPNAALLILAGGDGTRLHFNGPKGCFPLFKNETLFSIFFTRIAQMEKALQMPLQTLVMVSESNHKETKAHFEENKYFGKDPNSLYFIEQPSELFENVKDLNVPNQPKYCPVSGPGGNGQVFQTLSSSSVYQTLLEKGLKHVLVIPVDNPLADPFDPELLGTQIETRSECSLRTIFANPRIEKIGWVKTFDQRTEILDYTDFKNLDSLPLTVNGNTNLFAFSNEFIDRIAKTALPWHSINKTISIQSEAKDLKYSFTRKEQFITDSVPLAESISLLPSPRMLYFSPLKTRDGDYGIEATTQRYKLKLDLLKQLDSNRPILNWLGITTL